MLQIQRLKRLQEKTPMQTLNEEIQDTIARWTFGDGMSRPEFRRKVIQSFGSQGSRLLSEMWDKRWLAIDGYGEVQVTGRWADYKNNQRVANEEMKKG